MERKVEKYGDQYELRMNVEMRRGFVKKVFLTLFLQLLLTAGIVYVICTTKVLLNLYLTHVKPVLIVSSLASIGLCLFSNQIHGHPNDIILLLLFTICESLPLVYACKTVQPSVAISAFFTTICVTLTLTIYAMFTKSDFTGKRPYFHTSLWVHLMIGLLRWFGLFRGGLYTYLGVILYSMYLVYDVQLCIGTEKFGREFSVDDYIPAVMNIYLDMINLFIKILKIMNEQEKRRGKRGTKKKNNTKDE